MFDCFKFELREVVRNFLFPLKKCLPKIFELFEKHQLHLVTARQSYEMAINQINALQWNSYFTSILVTKQEKEKSQLILENIKIQKNHDLYWR